MSVRVTYHSEISHDTAGIYRRRHQNVLSASSLHDLIDFFAAVALKAEMLETGFHCILTNDQTDDRVFAFRSCGTEPDIVPTLEPAITNDRKPTKRCIDLYRSVDIARIDHDVCPAW